MVDTSPQGIGNRIRKRRKALGFSQSKLAKALKIPQQTIAGWEKGVAKRPRFLMEAAKVLCTTQEWLLREEGPEVVARPPRQELTETIESMDQALILKLLDYARKLKARDAAA